MNNYSQEYIDECRAAIDAQVAAYKKLVAVVRDRAAVQAFEPVFFNNMVLALENYFVHRSRGIEGKDGNPLNEVRVLCSSMMSNKGIMSADKTIRLKPEKSLLKYQVGDEIKLSEGDFLLLSKSFFAEIESKYVKRRGREPSVPSLTTR
jgi:hypothetical protein